MKRSDRIHIWQTGPRQFRAAYRQPKSGWYMLEGTYNSYSAAKRAAEYELYGAAKKLNPPKVALWC